MNIQEENSACYFRVQSEREQTLVQFMPHIPSLEKGSGGRIWVPVLDLVMMTLGLLSGHGF